MKFVRREDIPMDELVAAKLIDVSNMQDISEEKRIRYWLVNIDTRLDELRELIFRQNKSNREAIDCIAETIEDIDTELFKINDRIKKKRVRRRK